MNIVTFETAKRLKEAGFPQPELHNEQFWYNEQGNIVCFGHSVDNWGETDYGVDVFAPAATDIMQEIEAVTLYFDVRLSKFRCSGGDTLNGIGWVDFTHEKPAEAAALAWLAAKSADNVRRPDDFYEFGE